MTHTNRILVAGATGYLGSYVVDELKKQGYLTRALVRNASRFGLSQADEIIEAEMTQPASLKTVCKGVDTVISCVGITRQKDGLSYMDVDYRANLNLLKAAKEQGVRKFVYISVLNGDKLRNLQICAAKEKFVDALKSSGLEYCVVRPNGFFSDLSVFHKNAKKGKITLFGKGQWKSNPIHGKDLAKVVVEQVEETQGEIPVGGPDILTQTDIAEYAFISHANPVIISYLPDWIRRLSLKLAGLFLPKSKFGPLEFFMTVMAMDMIAPKYGSHSLKDHFLELSRREAKPKQILRAAFGNGRIDKNVNVKSGNVPAAA